DTSFGLRLDQCAHERSSDDAKRLAGIGEGIDGKGHVVVDQRCRHLGTDAGLAVRHDRIEKAGNEHAPASSACASFCASTASPSITGMIGVSPSSRLNPACVSPCRNLCVCA